MLAAGKSFFGGHGAVAYRETRRPYVPKFNNDKNPFAPKAAAEKQAAVMVSVPVANQGCAPAARPARPARVAAWAGKLISFRAEEPVRPVRRAVQSELSLQTLTVVQNDYSESDIERVPAKSCTLPPEPARPAPRRWEILTNAS